MRTTIELPDELYRQAKARAALSGSTLKDLVAYWVARGLQSSDDPVPAERARSRALPVIIPPCGREIAALSNAEIATLLEVEDAAAVHADE